MTAKGHILLSLPIGLSPIAAVQWLTERLPEGLYVAPVLNKLERIFYWTAFFLGSLFPDIDEPNSYLSRRLPFISAPLSLLVKHRGITHLLFVPIGIALVGFFGVENNLYRVALYAFALGIWAHTVGDLITKEGIRGYFYPFFQNTKIALLPRVLRFYVGSTHEKVVMLFLLFLDVYLLIHFYDKIIF